jgi:hypothetical protein
MPGCWGAGLDVQLKGSEYVHDLVSLGFSSVPVPNWCSQFR